ncbi:hypothetical protein [Limosilactobacillus fermentum]
MDREIQDIRNVAFAITRRLATLLGSTTFSLPLTRSTNAFT